MGACRLIRFNAALFLSGSLRSKVELLAFSRRLPVLPPH